MKEYFVNPAHFIVQSVFMTLVLGALAFGSISTGDPEKIVIGIICFLVLVGIYGWALSQVKRPAIRIEGDSVTVRGVWGRVQKVEDVREWHLVVSNTWIGFRRAGQQDVIIDRGRFSRRMWFDLEARLRALPVAGVI